MEVGFQDSEFSSTDDIKQKETMTNELTWMSDRIRELDQKQNMFPEMSHDFQVLKDASESVNLDLASTIVENEYLQTSVQDVRIQLADLEFCFKKSEEETNKLIDRSRRIENKIGEQRILSNDLKRENCFINSRLKKITSQLECYEYKLVCTQFEEQKSMLRYQRESMNNDIGKIMIHINRCLLKELQIQDQIYVLTFYCNLVNYKHSLLKQTSESYKQQSKVLFNRIGQLDIESQLLNSPQMNEEHRQRETEQCLLMEIDEIRCHNKETESLLELNTNRIQKIKCHYDLLMETANDLQSSFNVITRENDENRISFEDKLCKINSEISNLRVVLNSKNQCIRQLVDEISCFEKMKAERAKTVKDMDKLVNELISRQDDFISQKNSKIEFSESNINALLIKHCSVKF